ncbi:MAG: DNA-binding transcriptional regulator [Pirellulales bacterium]|nr:DNA-binding transcriptional regulator [Pirellulales bacterium]
MTQRRRCKVALLVESSRYYGRVLLRGIGLYARTHTNWAILHQELASDAMTPAWLESASVDGVLARVETQEMRRRLTALGVPVVDLRCRYQMPGVPQVETDEQQVSRLAFEHLHQRGFRRFAFCGFQTANYSQRRLECFRQLVRQAGCEISVYQSPGRASDPTNEMELAGLMDINGVSRWLATLTPPTGVFACNDIRGQQVLSAWRAAEISVPDDVGVIGVDDDDAICPLCDPPLSSVRPDAERVGYRAAQILHEMLRGVRSHAPIEYIPPASVAPRLSTQVDAVDDREVARACQFIREHACEGISAAQVADYVSISRRQLERRFRKELERTLHSEITRAQVARVKQLLVETVMTLEQITPLAGYSYKERLCAVFKREVGMTPGEYRREHSTTPPAPGETRPDAANGTADPGD